MAAPVAHLAAALSVENLDRRPQPLRFGFFVAHLANVLYLTGHQVVGGVAMIRSTRTPEARLLLFVRRVHEMAQLRAFREGSVRASFHVYLGDPRRSSFDIGDVEDFRSALLAFRHFTADKEDTHFESIANLVEQHVTECRADFRRLRRDWKQARAGGGEIVVNGQVLDGFDLMVNGEIFHDNPDKERILAACNDTIRGLLQHQTVDFLLHGSQVLWAAKNSLVAGIPGRLKAAETA